MGTATDSIEASQPAACPPADRRLRIAGWCVAAVGGSCGLLGFLVDLGGSWKGIAADSWIGVTVGAGLSLLGAFVIDHLPRNRAAWVLVVGGLLLSLQGLINAAAGAVDPAGANGAAPMLLFAGGILETVDSSCGPLFLFLFPDGRPPLGRWRWVWRLFLGFSVAVALPLTIGAAWSIRGPVLAAHVPEPQGILLPAVEPFGLHVLQAVDTSVQLWYLVAAAWLIFQLRVARGVRRRQLQWAVLGMVGTVLVLVAGYQLVGAPAAVVSPFPLYVGVVIAMRRHQLWDITRIVRRAVQYAGLSLVLAGTYGAVVVALGILASALAVDSSLAVAGATLVAAMAFAPLRRVAQHAVDRRFDRRTWQAVKAIEAFTERLRDGMTGPEEVTSALRTALGEEVRVRYLLPDGALVDGEGHRVAEDAGPGWETQIVMTGGHKVAVVDLPVTLVVDEPALVRAALTAAALPLENAALHARAAVQLSEVEASRSRLVEASDVERRRIERNLHDGTQQRLVALALRLRMSERRLAPTDPGEAKLLSDAVDELRAAVDELRDLTRGMLPPVLAEDGLAVAISALASRLPIPIDVDVLPDRLPERIEAAAWFVVCEGVTNALKHSGAGLLAVRVSLQDDHLHVEVRDDGKGGAGTNTGGGIEGLADRVNAVGGNFRVESPAGRGTMLVAELPCG